MIDLKDFQRPFDAIVAFESAMAQWTGAPYCVTTDCCTHAIEIAFRLAHDNSEVKFPARTYLSVPMTMHKLNIPYTLEDRHWRDSYRFAGSRIWDCARRLEPGMYEPGQIQCISFGMTKPLEIGQGGCLLTDDIDLYQRASRMRYDGRDIFQYSPWPSQQEFHVGFHYYLRPEECVVGLNLLERRQFTAQLPRYFDYPDCRNIRIIDEKHSTGR